MGILSRVLARPASLRELGIVGMNRRNIDLIARLNPRRLYPLVDNKLRTKQLAEEHGIPVPGLIHAVDTQRDIRELPRLLARRSGFCIKPAKGSGGKGILVITGRKPGEFIKSSGMSLRLRDISHHVSNILSGLFSLGGSPDTAVIEELIEPDPIYDDLSVEGVPDIRIIVYRGVPIMAMMRLSTRASDGKANLHQGAVGVGLCIQSGRSVNAVQFNDLVATHPDSGADLRSIEIPNWHDMLELSARCADATGLGYLGCDVVLDVNRGPLLLELNARPGLAIQIANGSGLAPRVAAVDELLASALLESPADRASRAQSMFAVLT
ncbi:MAG: alpha-L-glutamate ligase-like protein [Pseudomonadota bacterium]